MRLLEELAKRSSALKVGEVAAMFGFPPQHIYKMAANGEPPFFRVAGAVDSTCTIWPCGLAGRHSFISRDSLSEAENPERTWGGTPGREP
jgi:hypothetical protein